MTNRALCVGINDYPGTGNDLAGCVNDAYDAAEALAGRGFEVVTLTDADATRDNIIRAIQAGVATTGYRETFLTWISSHGTFVPDTDGDERDGRDEAFVPHDFARAGVITDDTVFALFNERHHGARTVIVADSCHSGTVNRFIMDDREPEGPHPVPRYLPPGYFLRGEKLAAARAVATLSARGKSRTGALLLAGCQDDKVSYDAVFDGRPNGAFSRAALDTLAGLPEGGTFADWFAAIRTKLPTRLYQQVPQMVASTDQRRWPVP